MYIMCGLEKSLPLFYSHHIDQILRLELNPMEDKT
jgi:hypothetical protein